MGGGVAGAHTAPSNKLRAGSRSMRRNVVCTLNFDMDTDKDKHNCWLPLSARIVTLSDEQRLIDTCPFRVDKRY